jgi:hypothetical protein
MYALCCSYGAEEETADQTTNISSLTGLTPKFELLTWNSELDTKDPCNNLHTPS